MNTNEQLLTSEVPRPLEYITQLSVDLGDTKPKVLFHLGDPEVILFSDVFTSAECETLISLTQNKLVRSYVFDNQTGSNVLDPARTSKGTCIGRGEFPFIDALDERLAKLANWPLNKTEQMQFLKYDQDEKYTPHFDFFHVDNVGSKNTLEYAGNRVATIIAYLQEPEEGGSTFFPDLNLRVNPIRGSALFFSYNRASPDTKTLHSGEPVISGTKYIVTKWFREKQFQEI